MGPILDLLSVRVCILRGSNQQASKSWFLRVMIMEKIKQLQQVLHKKGIDYLILMNDGNIIDTHMAYYTTINIEYALLIVPKKGSALFAIPSLEYERVRKFFRAGVSKKTRRKKTGEIIIKEWKPGFLKKYFALPHGKKRTRKNLSIGLNYAALSVLSNKAIRKATHGKVKDMSQELRALRMVKNNDEIALIKEACRITKAILQETVQFLEKKSKKILGRVTELDIVTFMEASMKEHGTEPAFPTIVASGKNAALPHHSPQRKVLQKGFLIIDVGVRYKGYCSDITRTFYLGKPSEQERRAYYKVRQAQEASLQEVRGGAKAKHVDQAARNALGEKYEKYFIHSTGHGLGMDVHEGPHISKTSSDVLQEGMIITIEPGLYFPNAYGIRIEDDVLVKKEGYEILTKISSSFNDIIIRN